MRELIRRFRAWQARRHWRAHQMEHLRLMLQEDGRWMAHNPIAAALTDRYLAATAEDWYQQVFVHSGHLREQLGLDPHAKREHARAQTATASCAGYARPLSVAGLCERDALSTADVDQPVAVAAAKTEEEETALVDLRRDRAEHHLQPTRSALPHGESPVTVAEKSSTGELRTNDAAQPAAEPVAAVPHVVAPHPELQDALFCYATGDDGASAILIRGWPALVAQVESEVARGDTPWSELLADLDYWSTDGWDVPHRYNESFEDGYMAIYRISEPAAQTAQAGGDAPADDWQQYAKEGENAQDVIERWRSESGALVTLLADARQSAAATVQTAPAPALCQAARDVLEERARQTSAEGYAPEHDDEHWAGDLVRAAVSYAWPTYPSTYGDPKKEDGHQPYTWCPYLWPWDQSDWKPKGKRRNLVRAAALLIADIERLDRAAAKNGSSKEGGAA